MKQNPLSRRHFMRNATLGALAFEVNGISQLLTPRAAHAASVPLRVFGAEEAALLGALADVLVPGAKVAGVVNFIDQQLSVAANDCMLMCKFFPELKAPFDEFYRGGLKALSDSLREQFDKDFASLDEAKQTSIIDALWRGDIKPWIGPPPPLFYMMVRSDAVDVVYGTEDGFKDLNIPYMAHIAPPEQWS